MAFANERLSKEERAAGMGSNHGAMQERKRGQRSYKARERKQGKQSREGNGEEAGDRNETNASNNRRSRDGKQWREEREGKAWYECIPLKPLDRTSNLRKHFPPSESDGGKFFP